LDKYFTAPAARPREAGGYRRAGFAGAMAKRQQDGSSGRPGREGTLPMSVGLVMRPACCLLH